MLKVFHLRVLWLERALRSYYSLISTQSPRVDLLWRQFLVHSIYSFQHPLHTSTTFIRFFVKLVTFWTSYLVSDHLTLNFYLTYLILIRYTHLPETRSSILILAKDTLTCILLLQQFKQSSISTCSCIHFSIQKGCRAQL